MDTRPFSSSTTSNWVAKAGGLPPYVRGVARALMRNGHTESEAIQIAIGVMKRAIKSGKWASLKGHAHASTLAKSGASVAQWEVMKAKADLSGDTMAIDLAYQWKHGWIPLTPASLAVKLGKAHGHADGVKSADAKKALGTHKHFREGFEAGRKEAHGSHGERYSPGDLRDSASKHDARAKQLLDQHASDPRFFPKNVHLATMEAGHAAGLRHEATLGQRRFHAANLSSQYTTTGKPTSADAETLIARYITMHGKAPSPAAQAKLRRKAVTLSGAHMSVDLATHVDLLPDMDSVKKAAGKLSKLPPPLRKAMAARLAARAKALGGTLELAKDLKTRPLVDLAIKQMEKP